MAHWRRGDKIPDTTYEISPEPSGDPLERLIEDIRAAFRLGIPFSVTPVERRAFRHGGNVNKADISEYVVRHGRDVIEVKED
jgi:hypothetical protein